MSQTATPSRPSTSARDGKGPRRNPITRVSLFVRQVVAELRKVIWPTRTELVTYTVVSVTFVVFMIAFVALMDYAFTKGMLGLFG
jgi:preprotein translocase subunit SecE